MTARTARLYAAAALAAALAACGRSAGGPAGDALVAPSPAASFPGALRAGELGALLLQPADVPALTQRRTSTSAAAVTEPTPQLALCRPPAPAALHQSVNLLAKGTRAGGVTVFEIVHVYASEQDAARAYDVAAAAAAACSSYLSAGTRLRVADLARLRVTAPARAVQYRLATPDVVGGDVRSLGVVGRATVLVSGYGAPPDGTPLLRYQAALLVRALAQVVAGLT